MGIGNFLRSWQARASYPHLHRPWTAQSLSLPKFKQSYELTKVLVIVSDDARIAGSVFSRG